MTPEMHLEPQSGERKHYGHEKGRLEKDMVVLLVFHSMTCLASSYLS